MKQYIKKQMPWLMTAVLLISCQLQVIGRQQEVIRDRLTTIQRGLDTMIFVNRFESIEASCLYIDEQDSSMAHTERKTINSNYRIRLAKGKEIDTNGVKCLSQHVARYLRLRVKTVDTASLYLAGIVETTYAYPASSIIQLLGFTRNLAGKTDHFFDKLIKLTGTFTLYPEDDKYRIKMVLDDTPYDPGDAYFGYLEIVEDAFKPHAEQVFLFRFDQMSIKKGDNNNQIAVNFSSTTHTWEMQSYIVLAYNVLRHRNSKDLVKRANAIWLDNFLKNPRCLSCQPVYNAAQYMVTHVGFALPNTSPVPAH